MSTLSRKKHVIFRGCMLHISHSCLLILMKSFVFAHLGTVVGNRNADTTFSYLLFALALVNESVACDMGQSRTVFHCGSGSVVPGTLHQHCPLAGDVAQPPVIWFRFMQEPHPVRKHFFSTHYFSTISMSFHTCVRSGKKIPADRH